MTGLLVGAGKWNYEPLPSRRILRMVAKALALIWAIMMSILVGIYAFAGTMPVSKRRPSFEEDRRLMAVAMAHSGEYVLGGIAVVVLMTRIARLKA